MRSRGIEREDTVRSLESPALAGQCGVADEATADRARLPTTPDRRTGGETGSNRRSDFEPRRRPLMSTPEIESAPGLDSERTSDRPYSVGAAVDIGSNSVHLLVAAVTADDLEALVDESVFLGLGTAIAARGYLGGPARA